MTPDQLPGRPITEFELIDHAIEHGQYFQGCGIACTNYQDVATGIGNNPAEAINDALDSLALQGWDVEGMEERILEQEFLGKRKLPKTPCVLAGHRDESYYYVSIRVSHACGIRGATKRRIGRNRYIG